PSGTSTSAPCCAPTTSASPRARRCCPCGRSGSPARWRATCAPCRSWTSWSGSRRACPRACTTAVGSSATSWTCSATSTARATSASCATSSTCLPPISTPASGSSSARTAGTTCRSPPPWPPPRRCRWSKPVSVKGRHLVDGGLQSTTNLDVAVEHGAKLVIVVNPLVPYINDFQKMIPTMFGSRVRRVTDMGFPQIGYQSFKLLVHQRLHDSVRQWSEKYPGVDIILIEPEPNDELMFETNIMNFTKRVEIARHGFESVTIKLAKDYDRFAEICAKHGIEISATRVRRVMKHFEKERASTNAWRRILEQTTGALLRQAQDI